MKPFWALLSILCLGSMFYHLTKPDGTGPMIAALVMAMIFGGLFNSAHQKDQDRKRQIEINDRLARIEERTLDASAPAPSPAEAQPAVSTDTDRPRELDESFSRFGLVVALLAAAVLALVIAMIAS